MRYLKVAGAAAVICIIVSVMLGAAENSDVQTVKNLLEKRTAVMENVLFGKMTYDEGKEQLKTIEKDKLYNDDLRALSQYRNTDLESVRKMEITEIEKSSSVYDIMTFRCRIKWTYSGCEGICESTHDYQVSVDTNGGDYRLVLFELLQ